MKRWRFAALAAGAMAVLSCGPESNIDAVRSIYGLGVYDGRSQTGGAGHPVVIRPAVRVIDYHTGRGVAGIGVTFTVLVGGGHVDGAYAITDGAGVATVGAWVLGNDPGVNTLRAVSSQVDGSGFTFAANGIVLAQVLKLSADPDNVPVGTVAYPNPTLQLFDAQGKAVSDWPVVFTLAEDGGSLTTPGSPKADTVLTNASGTATLSTWRVGGVPGKYAATSTAGLSTITNDPVRFTATAIPMAGYLRTRQP